MMSHLETPVTDGRSGSAGTAIQRRARTLLLVTAVLPLLMCLGLVVWRIGADARAEVATGLIAEAEAVAVDIRYQELTLPAPVLIPEPPSGRSVAYYAARNDWRQAVSSGLVSFDGILPDEARVLLESLDRAIAFTMNGRLTAVAPVKDVDQWDVLGAVLLVRSTSDPPHLPPRPVAVALAAGLAVTLLARSFAKSVARRSTDGRTTPAAAPAGLRYPPLLAIATALTAGTASAVLATWPGPGSHGLWAVCAFAAWCVIAGVGFSLVASVARPLELHEASRAWAFLAPSLAHLLLFSIGPIIFSLWLSFHEWDLLSPARPFVGLDNYRALAADPDFLRSLLNTALYVTFVPAAMVVALGLALLLNRNIPGVRVLRAVFFLPYITSFVAISLVWRWMFQPDVGLLNGILGWLQIPPQPWLSSPASALPSLMLMSVWMYAGYMMVIFLSGLQSIPASLYESARIDGAGAWQRFLHITLPLLRPTTLFVLVTMVIFMFQVFTAVYVMTEGGPLHATDVIVYHIYRNAWEYLRMGYASAMAWVLFAIVFLITLVQFRWLGGRTPT